ncbi:AAA family ATPase [Mycobacterium sp. PSTR-4-N]|uniref:bifunctional aminoglycoside phosphotransferase/ATP-binding protein n=1 Tax=Mycobacterium sp. PSTR-4-N TaxID=2917745 RepID=UPI001F149DC7|nr:AAA family ATPase [Mycobacterium sp. PSTR-4-N]MCG7592622.1 AAA family ATPase [Mycobacterium sp. PSTR-4-N]
MTAGDGTVAPWDTPGNLAAEVHETHTGLVVLVGDRAFKAKKPVRTDFLDFRTTEQRQRVCCREIELNRRLAPASYLGLGFFRQPDGTEEPVVVMRRYPESERLAHVIRTGAPADTWLMMIASDLARFHAGAERGCAIDVEATAEVLTARWQENLTELRRFVGPVIAADELDRVERLAMQFFAGRQPLYASRIADRRIVDGHGDLLSQDIFCTPQGPVLLDCLEFDDRLRYVDGVDDAAFLAMDVEFLGGRDLAERFLAEYCRQAGDDAPASLRHVCIAYRAVVRAKVDGVRVDQGHPEAAQDARAHLALASAHLVQGCVRLVMVGGGPGTGKTTLAHAVADTIDARVISTDEVRRELQSRGHIAGSVGNLDQGLYSPANVSAVYDEVLRRARNWLTTGHSVILDGTWRDEAQRRRARAVAAQTCCPLVELVCISEVGAAAGRIERRGPTASDATPAMAAELSGWTAEWTAAVRIDTTRPLTRCVADAHDACVSAVELAASCPPAGRDRTE